MKKSPTLLMLLAVIFILQATPALAEKPKVKGYYIDVAGQKNEIMIEVPTKMFSKKEVDNMQRNYFTTYDKRGKETKLTAKNATEFGFTFEGEDLVFRLLPEALQSVTHIKADFYKVLIEGPCTVYLTFVSQGDNYPEYCLYKNEGQYYVTTTGVTNRFETAKGRVATMEEFFSDCPDLVAKLKTKEYKKGDEKWFTVAQYYNQSCQASTEKKSGGRKRLMTGWKGKKDTNRENYYI